MKKKLSIIMTCILTLAICVCMFGESSVLAKGKNDASTVTGKAMKITKKTKATTEEMIEGYNNFSIRTLREAIAGEEEGKNVMISPASLMFALDMAAMGAKGKTYSQMAALIKKGATKRDLLNFAKDYRKALENGGSIDIANSIWINENNLRQNNVQINEKYLNLLRKHFKAAAASREFSETVKDEINAWISDKTKGMIPKTLDKLDNKTIMLIINAMAFEGKWKEEYKDYQVNENGKFTNYAGEVETAKMMSSEENIYFETENEKGFLKYYEGDKYAFMAILPLDEKISVNDYIKNLSDDAFTEFYKNAYYTDVDTVTPAFTFDYSINMNDMLQKLGMKKAFNLNAEFFSMLDPEYDTTDLALYIGSVIQKTHIELDEKGTKAAAVTVIDMKCEATAVAPDRFKKEVILNRPFAFAILDLETGTPVFEGIVNTVK
ncbi:MAG: serpin family protein [Lachnospiraceae bacterium]|nr:serpin family protein [Lachnospiraceae bacterium]